MSVLKDSEISCTVSNSGSSTYGWFSTNVERVSFARTRIRASGGATGIGIWNYVAENSETTISSSSIYTSSMNDASAIVLGLGPTAPKSYRLLVAQASVIVESPQTAAGVDVSSAAEIEIINTVIQSSDVAIHSAGALDLHGVYLDAPCALGDRSICDVSTTEQLQSCTWYGCAAAESCTVGDAGLGGPGVDPWVPSANSPLIDAGVDASGWSTDVDVDLYGAPRPQGDAPDIGAIEVR